MISFDSNRKEKDSKSMSTSDEWINVINAIENSTRIFLTIIIWCFVAFSWTLPGGLLGAD